MSMSGSIMLCCVLTLSHIIYVQAQSHPQLMFHFVANTTSKNKLPDTKSVKSNSHLDYLIYDLMCKSPGNRFVIRISPSVGSTQVEDEANTMQNNTEGVKSCFPQGANPIKCDEDNFCILDNKCTATVMSVCQRHGKSSRWMMTQMVDVTLDQVDGSLVMVRCLTKCESVVENEKEEDNGISYMAVGLIVGGVVLAASLFVIAVVVWKIRDTKYLEHPDQPHHIHHIHYVK